MWQNFSPRFYLLFLFNVSCFRDCLIFFLERGFRLCLSTRRGHKQSSVRVAISADCTFSSVDLLAKYWGWLQRMSEDNLHFLVRSVEVRYKFTTISLESAAFHRQAWEPVISAINFQRMYPALYTSSSLLYFSKRTSSCTQTYLGLQFIAWSRALCGKLKDTSWGEGKDRRICRIKNFLIMFTRLSH
jgi:hypothetical protein